LLQQCCSRFTGCPKKATFTVAIRKFAAKPARLKNMYQSHRVYMGTFLLALLAAAFCFWSGTGNDLGLCAAAGCSLYQNTTIAGISLWWIGSATFLLLGLPALLGMANLGRKLSGLALFADTGLLLLMSLTAPCTNCLVAAAFFALLYRSFRQKASVHRRLAAKSHSRLLLVWLLLFIINLGAVAHTQASIWAISDNSENASVRVFFSPSCPSCREAVAALSGHIDVAFFPIAESSTDLQTTAHMLQLLNKGSSMIDALVRAKSEAPQLGLRALHPDMLLLRFRMLRNKAHIFTANAHAVPFIEYHGMPSMLRTQKHDSTQTHMPYTRPHEAGKPASDRPYTPQAAPQAQDPDDYHLPIDPSVAGQCTGARPCPQ
jgi:hypothetical protein